MMAKKDNSNKNIFLVSILIGIMLVFMLGAVIYVTSQVANCSSVKKARKICNIKNRRDLIEVAKADNLPWDIKS